jgi:hypothetical protein
MGAGRQDQPNLITPLHKAAWRPQNDYTLMTVLSGAQKPGAEDTVDLYCFPPAMTGFERSGMGSDALIDFPAPANDQSLHWSSPYSTVTRNSNICFAAYVLA